MTTFIIDTDIGTDVDDALALCLMISDKPRSILGVVTTNGPTKVRAQVAQTILAHSNASHIPVFRGVSAPLTKNATTFTTGKEHEGVDVHPHAFPLPSFYPTILSQPDKSVIYILLAPATSCATLLGHPLIRKKIKAIVAMGGVVGEGADIPVSEHNITADPIAFRRMIRFQKPLFLIPLNLTLRLRLPTRTLKTISRSSNPLAKKVQKWIENWLNFTASFGRNDYWFKNRVLLHDPITTLAATHKSAFHWRVMKFHLSDLGVIHLGGNHTASIAQRLKNGMAGELISRIELSIVTHKNMI